MSSTSEMYELVAKARVRMDPSRQMWLADWAVRNDDSAVFNALVARQDLTAEALERLADSADLPQRVTLARHHDLPDTIWERMRDESSVPVLVAAAANPSAPVWMHRICIERGNVAVLEALVTNLDAPADVQIAAAAELTAAVKETDPVPRKFDWLNLLLLRYPETAGMIVGSDAEIDVQVQTATTSGVCVSEDKVRVLLQDCVGRLDDAVATITEARRPLQAIRIALQHLSTLAAEGPLTDPMLHSLDAAVIEARQKTEGLLNATGINVTARGFHEVAVAIRSGIQTPASRMCAELRHADTTPELTKLLDSTMSSPIWTHRFRRLRPSWAALSAAGCSPDLVDRVVDGTERHMLPRGEAAESIVAGHIQAGRLKTAVRLLLHLADPSDAELWEDALERCADRLGRTVPDLTDEAVATHLRERRFEDLWRWTRRGRVTPEIISTFPVSFLNRLRYSPQAAESLLTYLQDQLGSSQLAWEWFEALLGKTFHGTIEDLTVAALRMTHRPDQH